MVPGSTLRYGSHFCRVTLKPRLSRRQPIEEAATPFPREETTPPVTKIYFGAILIARVPTPGLFALHRSDVRIIIVGTGNSVKSNSSRPKNNIFSAPPRNLSAGNGFVATGESCVGGAAVSVNVAVLEILRSIQTPPPSASPSYCTQPSPRSPQYLHRLLPAPHTR